MTTHAPVHQGGPPDRIREVAIELAGWAATSIAGHPAAHTQTKAHAADLVTDLDQEIEVHIRGRIEEVFPDHAFIGEEFGETGSGDALFRWYCDPIDGTTNYANGMGWCSFSLCCWDDTGPLVGVVADPFRQELFCAVRERGALRFNSFDQGGETAGTVLRARDASTLAGTVVTTEWAAHEPWPGMPGVLSALADASCTTRVMGSSALSMVQVAAGRAAGCVLGQNSRIDVSAAALIAAEAGAFVGNLAGPGLDVKGLVFTAAPGVLEQLKAILEKALPHA